MKIGLGLEYRSHRFAAANQLMPQAISSPGAAVQIREVGKWLHGERVVPEIQKVWPRGPIVPIEIKVPAAVKPGGIVNLQLVLPNKKIGRSFPTGPLSVVRVWIELDVRDQARNEVYRSDGLDALNHLEAGTYALRPITITEDGRSIMAPEIWHPNGPNYRPAIAPEKSESFDYRFRVPRQVEGPLVVNAHLRYHKANQFFIDAVYPYQNRKGPIADISSDTVRVSIDERTASWASVSASRTQQAQ